MPTFQITLLGNVFVPGAVISATLLVVAKDDEQAADIASKLADTLWTVTGHPLTVDAVYRMARTVN